MDMGAAVVCVGVGLSSICIGLTGKEFYPGKNGKKRGLQPLPRWEGAIIFCLAGTGFLWGSIPRVLERWTRDDAYSVLMYVVIALPLAACLLHWLWQQRQSRASTEKPG
jgi:hypothetical protein